MCAGKKGRVAVVETHHVWYVNKPTGRTEFRSDRLYHGRIGGGRGLVFSWRREVKGNIKYI